MRVSVNDPALLGSLVGFLQRSRCLTEVRPDGTVEVYLPCDLPASLARAELESYLRLWARSQPGAYAALETD